MNPPQWPPPNDPSQPPPQQPDDPWTSLPPPADPSLPPPGERTGSFESAPVYVPPTPPDTAGGIPDTPYSAPAPLAPIPDPGYGAPPPQAPQYGAPPPQPPQYGAPPQTPSYGAPPQTPQYGAPQTPYGAPPVYTPAGGAPGSLPIYTPPSGGGGYGVGGFQPPSGGSGARLAGIAVLIAVLAAGIGAFFLIRNVGTSSGGGTVTASTSIQAGRGSTVFTDDFSDSSSGWGTDPLPSGTTFTYVSGGYQVDGKQDLHHFAGAPYTTSIQQLDIQTTATQSSGAPSGAGFGVSCERGTGTTLVRYELLVLADGEWYVERGLGPDSADTGPTLLKQGSADQAPGTTPMTIEGMCATLSDGVSTRLVMFVNGKQVADLTDKTPSALPDNGWTADLIDASRSTAPSQVTFTKVVLRDLAR